jgi:hypothetical protein
MHEYKLAYVHAHLGVQCLHFDHERVVTDQIHRRPGGGVHQSIGSSLLRGRAPDHKIGGVCAILLQLYTSMECLKRLYTSPGPFLEID